MTVDDRTLARDDRPARTPGPTTDRARPSALRLVMLREIRTRGRSGAFIGSTVVTLLLVLALIIVPTLFGDGATTHRIGVVGDGNQPIVDTAGGLARADGDDVTVETTTFDDVAAAEAGIDGGTVDAVLVDGRELLMPTSGGFGGSDLQGLLQRAAATREVEDLVGEQRAGRVISALTSDPLEVRALTGQDTAENEGRAWLSYGGLVLTYMVILTYGVWTLTGVTEEKANRVMELLLVAARPWHLLAGKILGISILGLSQFVLTVVAALVAIRVTGAFDLPVLPVDLFVVQVLWVVMGFGLYMVLCGAAGSLASKTEDAQSAMSPISMMAVGSFFLSFVVLRDPEGLAAVIGTFVPFSAPFVVPIRAAFGVLPLWQHLLSAAVCLVTVAGLLRLAGRVYTGGALQFGGRLKWREALRRADM